MKDDTISRQAAIDAIKKNTFRLTFAEEQNCEGHVAWSAEAVYSDVMEGALLELPSAQPEQQWTPCSERLPKYNTPVLLALKQIGKERTIVIGERRTRKSGWYFVDIAAYDPEHKVIAWMPLPEPYREERTEE